MKIAITILICFALTLPANAAIVFEENFDAQADWQPRPAENDTSPSHAVAECYDGVGHCTITMPTGFDYAYITGMWWGPTYKDGTRISRYLDDGTTEIGQPDGGVGKSLLNYVEPVSPSSSWDSDSLVGTQLAGSYRKLFFRMKMKFQSGWTWATGINPAQKFFRMGNYPLGSANGPWTYPNSKPLVFFDYLKYYNGGSNVGTGIAVRDNPSYDVSPQTDKTCYDNYYPANTDGVCYFPPDGSYGGTGTTAVWDNTGMPGDGGWHTVEVYMEINSIPGTADGKTVMWLDGAEINRQENYAFNEAGAADTLINFFLIGGNNNNWYDFPAGTHPEQWYAMDDVVVYEPIDSNSPYWATSPQDGRLPLSYTISGGSNITCYPDIDNDLYPGTGSESVTTCSINYYESSHFTSMAIDCDDTDPLSYPGAGSCVPSVATPLRTGAQITRTGTTLIRTQ